MNEDDRLIRLKTVCELTALSKATIYRMASAGSFPKPRRISHRVSAWKKSAVLAWIDGKTA